MLKNVEKVMYAPLGVAVSSLTGGSIYDVLDINYMGNYLIIDDTGEKARHDRQQFIKIDTTIEETRMSKKLFRCINNKQATGLTLGRVYEAIHESIDFLLIQNDKTEKTTCRRSRFEEVTINTVDKPLTEDAVNLFDFIEEKLSDFPLERNVIKQIIFSSIFTGELLSIFKKHKVSMAQASTIMVAFDEWTGASENN